MVYAELYETLLAAVAVMIVSSTVLPADSEAYFCLLICSRCVFMLF